MKMPATLYRVADAIIKAAEDMLTALCLWKEACPISGVMGLTLPESRTETAVVAFGQ
jgi:hypothetical protein